MERGLTEKPLQTSVMIVLEFPMNPSYLDPNRLLFIYFISIDELILKWVKY